MKAERHNKGKSPLSFLLEAPRARTCEADVLENGLTKYARGNWLKGLPKNEVIDSLLRHLFKYANGELLDVNEDGEADENHSGLPHVGHICCNATFLAELELRGDFSEETSLVLFNSEEEALNWAKGKLAKDGN